MDGYTVISEPTITVVNGNFYTVDQNVYNFYDPEFTYPAGSYIEYKGKLYQYESESKGVEPTSATLVEPFDNVNVNASIDDVKEILAGEGGTEGSFITQASADAKYATIATVNTKLDTATYTADKATFALKTELPNISGKLDTTVYEADKANFATKDELASKLDTASFETKFAEQNVDVSKLQGVISVDNLPATATATLKVVENEDAMLALTTDDVQNGDVVKNNETGKLFFVVDATKLNSIDGYVEFSATVDWASITNKPETFTPGTHTHDFSELTGTDNVATVESVNTKLDSSVYTSDKATFALKSEIPDVSIYAKSTDIQYIANTVIPQMNTNTANALNQKVDWDTDKKVISLPKDGSISALRNEDTLEGGVLLAQRTYDDGATFVTEVGTTKNKLTLNGSERPQVDIQGQDSEKVAFLTDIPDVSGKLDTETYNTDKATFALKTELEQYALKSELPYCVRINIRNPKLTKTVYERSEILSWFDCETDSELKKKILSEVPMFLLYGISLSGNQMYYRMPIEYIAYETANQLKLVFTGLDTTNDTFAKYVIVMNLDGTVIDEGNISLELVPMENTSKVSELETKITELEQRLAALEGTSETV